MIGIDITKISRFKDMRSLPRLVSRLNMSGDSPLVAAKTWACLEALVKAEGKAYDYSAIKIEFPINSAPKIIDIHGTLEHQYVLTLSHEDDIVVAVAMRVNA